MEADGPGEQVRVRSSSVGTAPPVAPSTGSHPSAAVGGQGLCGHRTQQLELHFLVLWSERVPSPFLPSYSRFLRSSGPEASPTVAHDPPTLPHRAFCHRLRLGEASVSALASLGAPQRPLSPEGIVRGLGGDMVPSCPWA